MPENILIALITAAGSVLGACIGAFAQIIAAKGENNGKAHSFSSSPWLSGIIGAITGASFLMLFLWIVGIVSISFTHANIKACDNYGIKIAEPQSGNEISPNAAFYGVYSEKPENADIWIVAIDRSTKQYSPRL